MPKARDAFRTIREVADWLEVPTHVLRFWESKFRQVAPTKGAGGRRYYRREDMLLLGGIKVLLHDQGLTIRGAQKQVSDEGVDAVMALSPPLALDDDADSADTPPRTPYRAARKGQHAPAASDKTGGGLYDIDALSDAQAEVEAAHSAPSESAAEAPMSVMVEPTPDPAPADNIVAFDAAPAAQLGSTPFQPIPPLEVADDAGPIPRATARVRAARRGAQRVAPQRRAQLIGITQRLRACAERMAAEIGA